MADCVALEEEPHHDIMASQQCLLNPQKFYTMTPWNLDTGDQFDNTNFSIRSSQR